MGESIASPPADAVLANAFDRLRDRLVAMVGRGIGNKLAARIDPEGVVHVAYLRAQKLWPPEGLKHDDMDGWIFDLTRDCLADAVLANGFDRLRDRLVAMVSRRIGNKLAARIDPEGVVHEAYLRAQKRWPTRGLKHDDMDVWIYGQTRDCLIEKIRGASRLHRDVDREIPWPEDAAGPLAEHLVDSHTGPSSALSRDERRAIVRAALEKLDPLDREILALRYFDGLEFAEVGEILGLSGNTANRRALRAVVKFRRLIPREFRPLGMSWS